VVAFWSHRGYLMKAVERPDPLRTAAHIGGLFGRSERTVRSWAESGCPSYRVAGGVRFREAEVRRWLQAREKPRRPEPTRKWGLIYFIGAVTGPSPIKIGWTVRVDGRIPALQTGAWEKLICHGMIPGTQADELAIHAELEEHRVHGEWFERDAALAALAARTRAPVAGL
jgi:Meiotically up-regulated gene 113